MQKAPLVSVILPVYNVEEYLEECFLSVKNQTYKNIEIIIVDDGATDNSGKIADKLAQSDKRTTVIHKKNGGLSEARNIGLKKARGEYVAFVDSDDCIDSIFVEALMASIVKNNADISQCDNSRQLDDLGSGEARTRVLVGSVAFAHLMKFKTISPTAWGKLYRRSLFTDNNLEFPVGRIHEDTAILYKLIYYADRVVCLGRVLYFYRVNDKSIMMANYSKRHYDSVVKYHDELDEFIINHKINISMRSIYKHKALRLLSILNKLALHNDEKSSTYGAFKLEYLKYTRMSYDLVCAIGTIPVLVPRVFRGAQELVPILRKAIGKT